MFDMRLFKRGGTYYVEIARGKKKSLKTGNLVVAERLFKALQKKQLEGRLHILERKDRILISDFIKLYTSDPDRKGLSRSTLRADTLAFNNLRDTLGDIPLSYISKGKIKGFKEISAARLSPHSVNTYLRHIKAGLNWAKEEGYLKEVPPIKTIRTGTRLHRTIDMPDLKRLLEQAKQDRPLMYHVIMFAIYTGARREEIVKARWEHIRNNTIRIIGKGNKERIIPFLPGAIEGMEKKDIGKIFHYGHTSTLSNYFREVSRDAGVTARFHDLRHTAATHMLKNGIDLKTVKEILGHSDIRTTEIYAEVLAAQMKKEMKKLTYDL
ncbi:MAG: tyrosine-type recombinase/integrase [Pseudomonadota bacterium]